MYALNNGSAKVCGFNTATARCRTAKQFAEFLEPDRRRLFPNLQWLATRSVTPRAEHAAYVGLVLPKDDPFWSKHAPGSEWNCKCDVQETDAEPSTQTHIPDLTPPRGLEGNPAITGEVFTDKVGYVRRAAPTAWNSVVKPMARDVIRQQHQNFKQTFDTSIGKVLVDDITIQEVSKGSATDDGYFLKQEIARNIDRYTDKLRRLPDETVDLGHNNHKKKFYRRKVQFDVFKCYDLNICSHTFIIKMGKFTQSGDLNLYVITEM